MAITKPGAKKGKKNIAVAKANFEAGHGSQGRNTKSFAALKSKADSVQL